MHEAGVVGHDAFVFSDFRFGGDVEAGVGCLELVNHALAVVNVFFPGDGEHFR